MDLGYSLPISPDDPQGSEKKTSNESEEDIEKLKALQELKNEKVIVNCFFAIS